MAIVMLLGRYLPMVFVLGLAGSLARQEPVAVTEGTLRTQGPMFVALTLGVALVLVFLTFLPVLSLGPSRRDCAERPASAGARQARAPARDLLRGVRP